MTGVRIARSGTAEGIAQGAKSAAELTTASPSMSTPARTQSPHKTTNSSSSPPGTPNPPPDTAPKDGVKMHSSGLITSVQPISSQAYWDPNKGWMHPVPYTEPVAPQTPQTPQTPQAPQAPSPQPPQTPPSPPAPTVDMNALIAEQVAMAMSTFAINNGLVVAPPSNGGGSGQMQNPIGQVSPMPPHMQGMSPMQPPSNMNMVAPLPQVAPAAAPGMVPAVVPPNINMMHPHACASEWDASGQLGNMPAFQTWQQEAYAPAPTRAAPRGNWNHAVPPNKSGGRGRGR